MHGWSGSEKDFSLGKNNGKAIDGRDIVQKMFVHNHFQG